LLSGKYLKGQTFGLCISGCGACCHSFGSKLFYGLAIVGWHNSLNVLREYVTIEIV
jgi:hypothetical protein